MEVKNERKIDWWREREGEIMLENCTSADITNVPNVADSLAR